MHFRHFLWSAALGLAPLTAASAQSPARPAASAPMATIDSLALARQFTMWFYAGQIDSLLAHYPPESRADTTVRAQLKHRIEQFALRAGHEVELLQERFVKRNGHTQYWRTAKYSDFAEPVLLRWVITPRGEIGGMGMGPASEAPPIDP